MLETMRVNRAPVSLEPVNTNGYWQYYGLRQAPFDESSQYAMYYPLPQWQQHVNFLQKFVHNKQQTVVLVTGALGSGKSILASQFIAQVGNEHSVYLIKSYGNLRVSALLGQIVETFNLHAIAFDTPLEQQLADLLAAFRQTQQQSVLLIDDAHRLPLESLMALMQLVYEQTAENKCLHLVLLGEPQLEARVNNTLGLLAQHAPISVLDLKALSFEETKSYLRHRLMKAGLAGNLPFSEVTLMRIYKLSGGVPGRINNTARLAMQDGIVTAQRGIVEVKSEKPKLLAILTNHMRIVAVLGSLVGIFFVWLITYSILEHTAKTVISTTTSPSLVEKHNLHTAVTINSRLSPSHNHTAISVNSMPQAPSLTPSAKPTALNEINQPTISKPVIGLSAVSANQSGADQAVAQQVPVNTNLAAAPTSFANKRSSFMADQTKIETSQLTEPNLTAQKPIIAASAVSTSKPSALPTIMPAPAVVAQQKAAPFVAVNQQPTTVINPTIKAVTATNVGNAKLITVKSANNLAPTSITSQNLSPLTKEIAAKQTGYAVQLDGSYALKDIQQFVDTHKLAQPMQYFQTTNAGQPWYVLVYGQFSDIHAAHAAIAKLPASFQQQKPWVRSFANIAQAIK